MEKSLYDDEVLAVLQKALTEELISPDDYKAYSEAYLRSLGNLAVGDSKPDEV